LSLQLAKEDSTWIPLFPFSVGKGTRESCVTIAFITWVQAKSTWEAADLNVRFVQMRQQTLWELLALYCLFLEEFLFLWCLIFENKKKANFPFWLKLQQTTFKQWQQLFRSTLSIQNHLKSCWARLLFWIHKATRFFLLTVSWRLLTLNFLKTLSTSWSLLSIALCL